MPEPTSTAAATIASAMVSVPAITLLGIPLGLRPDLLVAAGTAASGSLDTNQGGAFQKVSGRAASNPNALIVPNTAGVNATNADFSDRYLLFSITYVI